MPDSLTNDAAEEETKEEKKCSDPLAAEVAPGTSDIVRAPDAVTHKGLFKLSIGPDPATDDSGQLRGPSTSDSKIDGPT